MNQTNMLSCDANKGNRSKSVGCKNFLVLAYKNDNGFSPCHKSVKILGRISLIFIQF